LAWRRSAAIAFALATPSSTTGPGADCAGDELDVGTFANLSVPSTTTMSFGTTPLSTAVTTLRRP
jgi:hypothetical protein